MTAPLQGAWIAALVEVLQRCLPQAQDHAQARDTMRRLPGAKRLRVGPDPGTGLLIDPAGRAVARNEVLT
jgi:hypothetical protein